MIVILSVLLTAALAIAISGSYVTADNRYVLVKHTWPLNPKPMNQAPAALGLIQVMMTLRFQI